MFVLCLIGTSMYAQRSVRIGYIDTEYILENISEYSDANSQLDSKIQQWKSEIEKRLTELEDQKNNSITSVFFLQMSSFLSVKKIYKLLKMKLLTTNKNVLVPMEI